MNKMMKKFADTLASIIIICNPYIYHMLALKANSERAVAGIGGEVFIPILLLFVAHFLYNITSTKYTKQAKHLHYSTTREIGERVTKFAGQGGSIDGK